ncbi:MAG: hypothetical protein ACLFQV_09085 [Vulcanimicrobiota bacterium]
MRNKKYWQTLLRSLDVTVVPYYSEKDVMMCLFAARRSIFFVIADVITREWPNIADKKLRTEFDYVKVLYARVPDGLWKPNDYFINFLIEFLKGKENLDYLRLEIKVLEDELKKIKINCENRILSQIIDETMNFKTARFPGAINDEGLMPDKYIYETVGGILLKIIKLKTIMKETDYNRQLHYLKAAERILDLASLTVPLMKKELGCQENKFYNVDIENSINFLRFQIDLLGDINKTGKWETAHFRKTQKEEVVENLRNFFTETINPVGRKTSVVTLVDELEWAFIYYTLLKMKDIDPAMQFTEAIKELMG